MRTLATTEIPTTPSTQQIALQEVRIVWRELLKAPPRDRHELALRVRMESALQMAEQAAAL